uniref:Cytochrome P450 monooxygenase-like protein n=1 Tax=Nodulisporium sp. TaxID=1897413 RepID=A0A2R4QF45_9PEZI|nr:cytochrome P450 monooxygenase-like protein [Nodulisporium sp.]
MFQVVLGGASALFAHHVFFIHGEWHLSVHHIVLAHVFVALYLFYFSNQNHDTLGRAISCACLAIIGYLGTLLGSMSIYRLFFHKVSHFPGPRLASITKFWHIYQIRDSKNYLFQRRLHENSAIFTRDEFEHKERRKVWTQSLSTKAMDSLRPRIAQQAESPYRCIKGYGDQPVDVDEVMSWFSFDAMGEVVFGEDFNLMDSRTMHPAILHRDRALAVLGPISDAIWIARLAFSFIPFYGRVKDWFRMVAFCDERMRARMEVGIVLHRGPKEGKPDMASWFIEEHQRLASSMNSRARSLLLSGTATSAVVAGSDTTRASLIATWWYLSKYPEHADRVYMEIRDVNIRDANILATLPHLNGVINEVLRLVPPAMTGGGRITGPDGLLIDNTLIPPFTKVTAPKYVIMRSTKLRIH